MRGYVGVVREGGKKGCVDVGKGRRGCVEVGSRDGGSDGRGKVGGERR